MTASKRTTNCAHCDQNGGKTPEDCDIELQLVAGKIGTDGKARQPFQTADQADDLDIENVSEAAGFSTTNNPMVEAMLLANYGICARTLPHDIVRCYDCPVEDGFQIEVLSSAVIMREQILKWANRTLMAFRGYADHEIRVTNIRNERWNVEARHLLEKHPDEFRKDFKDGLRDIGIKKVAGALIAFLNCDFDPLTNTFQFYWRGVGTTDKVEALRKLGKRKGYKDATGGPPVEISKISDRVTDVAHLQRASWLSRDVRLDGEEWVLGDVEQRGQ